MRLPLTDPTGIILIVAAIGQLCIAALNFKLDRILRWTDEVNGLSRLLYEVYFVHKWFVSITLIIFGVLTIRFAEEMAGGTSELVRWLAASIGFFWLIRTAIQWFFYSSEHWRGKAKETVIHWVLFIAYAGCSTVYLFVAFRD